MPTTMNSPARGDELRCSSKRQRHSKPSWNPGRGSYWNNLWQVYSPKIGRTVKLYSDLEYHHWILVEATPEIVTFCEQPVRMQSRVDGRDRASYADMWVQWRDGTEQYRELKYAKDMAQVDRNPSLSRQLTVQAAWCKRHDVEHVVVTDEAVFANKLLLRNWRLILSVLTNAKGADLRNIQAEIQKIVDSHGTISLGEARAVLSGPSETIFQAAAFDLIQRGTLKAPLESLALTYSLPLEVNHVI
jgi:TnsA-like endonuclease N terminal